MAIAVATIKDFAQKQVENGSVKTVAEANEEIAARLFEMELDEKIARGRAEIQAGEGREMTEESNAIFLKKIEKRLFPNMK